MLINLYISCIYSAIFPVKDNQKVYVYQEVADKTIILAKVTLMTKNIHTGVWTEVDDSYNTKTICEILKPKGEDNEGEVDLLFSDSKYDTHCNFFFISNRGAGLYTIRFKLNAEIHLNYGLKIEVFTGKSTNTEIVSGIDYHLSILNQKVADLLAFARANFDIEELTEKNETRYVTLYNTIFGLVFKIAVAKIIVLFVTIFFINNSMKKFFISQKIAK